MTPLLVVLSEDVEKERLDVVVESLVVQEELDEQTEVLAVDLVCVAVYLEDAEVVLPAKEVEEEGAREEIKRLTDLDDGMDVKE